MIIGIGNDLVDGRRIQKVIIAHGTRFLERCFTPYEREQAEAKRDDDARIAFLAKRFAAKEACAKALGTGFVDDIYMKDIGVCSDDAGKPYLALTGGAKTQMQRMIPQGMHGFIHLSLSDEIPYAQAFVIIEARAQV